ncbi:MAG: hypothetical protein ACOYOI_07175, partial [Chthoniobacterales bacterium]
PKQEPPKPEEPKFQKEDAPSEEKPPDKAPEPEAAPISTSIQGNDASGLAAGNGGGMGGTDSGARVEVEEVNTGGMPARFRPVWPMP